MSDTYDFLIANARIVDGTGAPGFSGGIGIVGERIAAVGDVRGDAAKVIDATGLVLCPGFIDPHSHADSSILVCPGADNLVMQGVTTFVGGNCGLSLAPVLDAQRFRESLEQQWGVDFDVTWRTFAEWLRAVEDRGLAPNYAPLVGHNTVREAVLGDDLTRPAASDEVKEMKAHVREAMEAGAFGLSAGLDPAWTGHFADVSEIIELARVSQAYGGLFSPHTRHHQNQWPTDDPSDFGYGLYHGPTGEIFTGRYHGLLEAVEICRQAKGVRLHIAHMTPAYIIPQPHPAFLDEAAAKATLVDIVDRARDDGLDVTYNVIPWVQTVGRRLSVADSFLGPNAFLPDWLTRLGREDLAQNLKSRRFRKDVKAVVYSGRLKFGMVHPLTDPYWMDCYTILECGTSEHVGRTLGDIAREREPHHMIEAVYVEALEALFDMIVEDPNATWALTIDKREYGALPVFLKHPAGTPCSDVQAYPLAGKPGDALYGYGEAPIAFGLYPHYLRRFVRETGLLSLEEAIMKATSVPAHEVLGIDDRGVIREGAYADIVVFDPETISETGDFVHPNRPPAGIEQVLVNGTIVWDGKAHSGAQPGKVLRRR